jgi:hypothetical protein
MISSLASKCLLRKADLYDLFFNCQAEKKKLLFNKNSMKKLGKTRFVVY